MALICVRTNPIDTIQNPITMKTTREHKLLYLSLPLKVKFYGRALCFFLVCLGFPIAHAQVGIGTTTPKDDAALEVASSDKGVLFPRMTSSERDAIANPTQGLTIYNRTENCLQWWNNSGWYDACTGNTFVAPVSGSNFTNGFENNTTCSSKLISVTPCSAVAGASINDDASTTEGIEYDWTEASNTTIGEGFGAPSNTRALVEIGGQCWAKFNMNIETNSGSFC